MTIIIVDAMLRSKLHNLAEPLELCDETGRVLGQFVPSREPVQYWPLEPQVSDEELERREQSTEWYTTDQVLKHLGSI